MRYLKTYIDLRWVLLIAAVPLIIAAIFIGGVWISGTFRYDAIYFTDAYREMYAAPGTTAMKLAEAIQTGDQQLLAELQGLRRPADFPTNPDIIFVMLWEREASYITYFYMDIQTYDRYMYHLEEVEGRWVVSPADAYYYLRSGEWLSVAMPIAIVWWFLEIVVVIFTWLYHLSAQQRALMYERGIKAKKPE
jgi:hypothetical protein